MAISLRGVLSSLKTLDENLYQDLHFRQVVAQHLTELGYEGCEDNENIEADQVRHVFYQAINIYFAKRVDLTTDPPDNQGLQELLCDSLPENITRREIVLYLYIGRITGTRLECPKDFLEHDILKNDASQTFVKKLIESQFQLQWDTRSGWPKNFSYYDFCFAEKIFWRSTKFWKNSIRNAQVKVQLYRHSVCHAQNNDIEATDLCPTVYVKTDGGQWRSLQNDLNDFTDGDGVEEGHFNWISNSIRRYILDEAEIIPELQLEASLTKHTLYWAVVEDSDFGIDTRVELNPIAKTQVYVGKANNGIKDRWLSNSSSHCRNMEKGLRCFRVMKTYDAEVVKDVQLVEAVLLLEKLKGNANSALFLMKTFDDEEQLGDTEGRNIIGKRSPNNNLNIVPSNENIRPRWQPIDVRYGMNVRR